MLSVALATLCSLPAFGCSSSPEGDSASSDEALTTCYHGSEVNGIDVWDGNGTIDWATVRASGVRFAFIKATQGDYNHQTTFSYNWTHAKEHGVIRGAYHFFDARNDGKAQAENFLRHIGTLSDGDLPPMLDIECPDGDSKCLGWPGGIGWEPGSVITTRMNEWLHTVKAATGMTPIVYSFNSYFVDNGVNTAGLASYPLFLAYPTPGSCFPVPAPWKKATIWQWAQDVGVPGVEFPADRDRFLGTLAELEALTKKPACPAPEHMCGSVCCPATMNCTTCLGG
jgi:GH25 family lysozyme M1 (1,4-beta-N-acetylmuramidase)